MIGELCRAGFVIEDLLEPVHGNAQAARASSLTAAATSRRVCTHQSARIGASSAGAGPRGESTALWTPLAARQWPRGISAWLLVEIETAAQG